MANRPWVTPQEVKDYSEYKAVINRPDPKLVFDISRAEKYIIQRTNNDFADDEKYPSIPDEIKLATILVAEFYANTSSKDPAEGVKSETFDDYSYTKYDNVSKLKVDDLDISYLVDSYVLEAPEKRTFMRMRKL